LVAEDFIVKMPALQVGDGRCLAFLVGPVDYEKSEKVRPSGFKNVFIMRQIPDLMLVTLLIRSSIQFVRRSREYETGLVGVVVENSEFLGVIGCTSLKARNCLTASA
jgi:hypothetical protein